MPMSCPSADQRVRHRHEAMFFRDSTELLAGSLAFIRDAIEADEPVIVAMSEDRWSWLRTALGSDAARVRHTDMTKTGKNPAQLMPALWRFIDEHRGTGRRVRAIGEPVWAGRREPELTESLLHEALLDVAMPPDVPVWLACPYDTATLDPDVLAVARQVHPNSAEYAGPDHAIVLGQQALPAPVGPTEELLFGHGDLCAVRELVAAHARNAGLGASRREDLVLGVNEVAANSLDHADGRGMLRIWREPGALVCEVQDSGRIHDPLVGRRPPGETQERGRGLWLVNQICDLVQIRSGPDGTVIRVHTWLEQLGAAPTPARTWRSSLSAAS